MFVILFHHCLFTKMSIEIVFEDDNYEYPNEFGVCLKKGYKLHPHQIEAIKWMKTREDKKKGGILSLYMGLGKTLTMTTLCMSEIHTPAIYNIEYNCYLPSEEGEGMITHMFPNLVICTKTIAYTWKNEIKQFYDDSCPYFHFHKDVLKKNFDLLTYNDIKNYKVIITSYETISGIAKKYDMLDNSMFLPKKPSSNDIKKAKGGLLLFKIPWNRIIVDESHLFSNPESSRFKSLIKLYGDKKWCLSGTPLRNYSSDLYSQLRFCGYNDIKSVKQFNVEVYNRNKLYEYLFTKNYKDTNIVLPPLIEHVIKIKLTDNEKEMYNIFYNETKKTIKEFLLNIEKDYSAVLALFIRLRQICISTYSILKDNNVSSGITKIIFEKSNMLNWVEDKYGTSGINSSKITKIIEILNNIPPTEKTLIFTSFKKVISIIKLAISKKLPNKKFLVLDGDVTGKERENAIDSFKYDKNINILLISYKVGSEGLNLIEANNIIFCENWWTPVVEEQAKLRSHRMGQTKPVNVWKLIIEDSIEERIEMVCKEKIQLQKDFLETHKDNKLLTGPDKATLIRIIK